jgi:hypothetical protein
MENVKGIFEGIRPIREGTMAIVLCALAYQSSPGDMCMQKVHPGFYIQA